MTAATTPLEAAPEAAPAPRSAQPLSRLEPGQRACIVGIDGGEPVALRLQELGFLPGTEVLAVRRAPLGDPTLFELRHTRLALREREARRIRVVLLDPPRATP